MEMQREVMAEAHSSLTVFETVGTRHSEWPVAGSHRSALDWSEQTRGLTDWPQGVWKGVGSVDWKP